MNINLINDKADCFFYRNICKHDVASNDSATLYDTSSSSSSKGGVEDNMFGNFFVSLMEYSFLHKGLK